MKNLTAQTLSILIVVALLALVGCGGSSAPEPNHEPTSTQPDPEPPSPNLRGLEGNYCYATTDQCTYGWPVPQAQLDAREIICPTVDSIKSDATTIVVCDPGAP